MSESPSELQVRINDLVNERMAIHEEWLRKLTDFIKSQNEINKMLVEKIEQMEKDK